MFKHRRQYTAQEKMSILRRHLVDGVPVSDLCDELGLQPTVFYRVNRLKKRINHLKGNSLIR